MSHRNIYCSCGWHKGLIGEDWGDKASQDKLLDVHAIHKMQEEKC